MKTFPMVLLVCLLGIDKDGQSVGFDNMQSQKLQGSSEWKNTP